MGLLKLFVDRASGTLRRGLTAASTAALPPLTQGDTVGLEISVVEDNPSGGFGGVSLVNLGSYSLKVAIGATPLGDGSVTPFALQTSWTLNDAQNKWTGSLALNTTALNTWLGTASTKQAWFEIEIRDTATGNYETIYGGTVTIRAQLISAGSSIPVPSDVALGTAEAAATYVRKQGEAGGSIILTSPDGTKRVQLYCDDDGTFHADVL